MNDLQDQIYRERATLTAANPRDGDVIEWWTADLSYDYKVRHHRATWYENTAWADHPWSKTHGPGGVAFIRNWANEEMYRGQWHSQGRNDIGWGGPFKEEAYSAPVFTNERVALEHIQAVLAQHIESRTKILDDMRRRAAEVKLELEAIGCLSTESNGSSILTLTHRVRPQRRRGDFSGTRPHG